MNMMNGMERHEALHAVIVPYSGLGHVYPQISLAQLLLTRGFFITFVNVHWIHKRITQSASFKNAIPPDQLHKIRFLSIPDGFSLDHDRISEGARYFHALQKLGPALEHLLRINEKPFPPITCIITDFLMSCTEQVATNLEVRRVIFWPTCAASSIFQCYANFLLSQGHIPVKICDQKLITCLPGNIPPLRPSDLSSFYRVQDTAGFFDALLYESEKQSKGDYVLVNTFEELEGRDAVAALSLNGCPALSIGPLFLPDFLQGRRDSVIDLWEEEEEKKCMRWLDMQHPASVIYVSFGSIAIKSHEQFVELALGLEGTGHPFLWVLRSDIAHCKSLVLPEGFEERTKERTLIVRWAPQLKVLGHASVGLFFTHSGWNSTLESMSMGVPVVGLPSFADQFLNCRFAKDVWRFGLDFEGVDVDEYRVVRKEEVEDVVRRMMKSSEGVQLKENALKLKDSAVRAVLPGGSSFVNLNTFVQDMVARKGVWCKNETA